MIEGKKINITSLNESDKDIILRWANKPSLKKYTGTLFPISDTEHEEWFSSVRVDSRQKIFGIRDKKNNTLYGVTGIKNIDYFSRNAELYIYIGETEFRGKGYATDAINSVVDFAFNRINLHKIYLRVFDFNDKAINMYKLAGFEIEGKLKEEYFYGGKYHDVYIMGKVNK